MEISTIASGQAPCLSGSGFKPAGFLKPMFTGEVNFPARNSFRAARLKKTNKAMKARLTLGDVVKAMNSSPRSDGNNYNEKRKNLMKAMKAKLEKKLKSMAEQSTLPSSQEEGAEALAQQADEVMTTSLAAEDSAAVDVQADSLAIGVDVGLDDDDLHMRSDEEYANPELEAMLELIMQWLIINNPQGNN